jgi:hypothetical protein
MLRAADGATLPARRPDPVSIEALMNRFALVPIVALALVGCNDVSRGPTSPPNFARGNPGSGAATFDYANASLNNASALVAAWKQHGVGNNDISYQLTVASTEFEWGCFNGGGKHPSATNKEASSAPLVFEFTREPRNGVVESTFTTPLPASPDFCPPGQRVRLISAQYHGIVFLDLTNGIDSHITPVDLP